MISLRLIKVVSNSLPEVSPHAPKIFTANHSSLFDILFFIAKYPTCTCIVKPNLANFSPYSILIYFAGYLVNSKESNIIELAIDELSRGNPVIIFPEGTRLDANIQTIKKSSLASLQPFQRGAATLSVRTNVPIVPVVISYDPPALGKGFRMHDLPTRVCNIKITAYPEMCASGTTEQGILTRELNESLERFYKQVLTSESVNLSNSR